MILLEASIASATKRRAGFCSSCGAAVPCDQLPEPEEEYVAPASSLVLSPDLPALPCFSKEVADWMMKTDPLLTWQYFKPITVARSSL
ncbi:hypothetical protein CGZ80_09010 [Rhodopirellula sp. MGV]|nr:hypothetical protein CGZ80_09010 [Rhodopirellula sp. MGV]PNY36859.1 hypothetical protein C2E31_10920 [Rhodopirellula baltica]